MPYQPKPLVGPWNQQLMISYNQMIEHSLLIEKPKKDTEEVEGEELVWVLDFYKLRDFVDLACSDLGMRYEHVAQLIHKGGIDLNVHNKAVNENDLLYKAEREGAVNVVKVLTAASAYSNDSFKNILERTIFKEQQLKAEKYRLEQEKFNENEFEEWDFTPTAPAIYIQMLQETVSIPSLDTIAFVTLPSVLLLGGRAIAPYIDQGAAYIDQIFEQIMHISK